MDTITLLALALPSIILLILVFWGWHTSNELDQLKRKHRELQSHLNATRHTAIEMAHWVVAAADQHDVDVGDVTLERARILVEKR